MPKPQSPTVKVEQVPIDLLVPYARNAPSLRLLHRRETNILNGGENRGDVKMLRSLMTN